MESSCHSWVWEEIFETLGKKGYTAAKNATRGRFVDDRLFGRAACPFATLVILFFPAVFAILRSLARSRSGSTNALVSIRAPLHYYPLRLNWRYTEEILATAFTAGDGPTCENISLAVALSSRSEWGEENEEKRSLYIFHTISSSASFPMTIEGFRKSRNSYQPNTERYQQYLI